MFEGTGFEPMPSCTVSKDAPHSYLRQSGGHGGGLAVSIVAFYSGNPGSNPADD